LPPGQTIGGRAVAAEAGRVFAAGHAVAHVRIADYATTGDRAFVTAGGRATFALVFTPGSGDNGYSVCGRVRIEAMKYEDPGAVTLRFRDLLNGDGILTSDRDLAVS
jgi:hypothetical protein